MTDSNPAEVPLTKVPEAPEAFVTSSRAKVKKPSAPAGKMWVRGRLIKDPSHKKSPKKVATGAANLAKGREALEAQRKAQKMVRDKIAQDQPVTPQEAALAVKQFGGHPSKAHPDRTSFEREKEILDKTASLIIKPANVHELRLKVEAAAKKYNYDPLSELIRMTQEEDLKAEDRISIHKTLLPFLVPTLPPIPKDQMEIDEKKVRVVVQQLHFAPAISAGENLFEDRPKRVDVEIMPPQE